MSTIRTVTDADFATVVLEAGGPVLVGFWPPVVRALPAGRAGPRASRARARRPAHRGPGERGREPGHLCRQSGDRAAHLDVYRDSQLVRSIRGARPKAAQETELADLQDDSTLS